ncbi:hypothetical protein KFZ76_22900 [Methylovulum psychrotolerans]|jgi:hypothetical protein|uniref:hypothetical protein n=1 Tax=Methylovulum psychrotolerans TaxID=1704499 RepID=UPI001BFFA108|nr:hypothetical protein [Methylovulum psychrotolerans]MBT9100553.1 hypothetical protein [Methylovulum psychrotolerans]
MKALYAKRNRPYLHTLVFVLLVSLVSLIISATCTMPMPSVVTAMSGHMPGCPESVTFENSPKDMHDCALKPCLDSQDNSPSYLTRIAQPDLPVFILGLIGTFLFLFLDYPPTKVPHQTDHPPSYRRIRLIYWFCTLLN